MAAFEFLLSQSCRHCIIRTRPLLCSQNPTFPSIQRLLFSSSQESDPDSKAGTPEPGTQSSRRPPPVDIQPVSYRAKPKEPSESQTGEEIVPPPSQQLRQRQSGAGFRSNVGAEARSWTREDVRYVKDVPNIAPVSYPTRVAPLPDDKTEVTAKEKEGDGGLEIERRKIEEDNGQLRRRFFRVEEEKVPFPTFLKVENNKKAKTVYDLKEAIQLVKANAKRNFDETLEAHAKLAAELRRSDLAVAGSVRLSHGTGRAVRMAVFAEGAAADEARAAGAYVVGGQELIEDIKNGKVKVDFDKCFATPDMVSQLTKQISKYLKRLMPRSNDGTVTNDVSRAVSESKKIISFKKDRTAIVHVGLGKVSLSEEALRENVGAFVNALLHAKPAGLKKSSKYAGYVNTFHICSSMGPSFPVSIQSLSLAADHYNRLQLR